MQMHGALEYFTAERSGINNKRDAGCVIADRSNRCSNGDAIPRLAGDRAGPRLRLQFRFRGASSEIFTCVRSRAFTVSSFARRIFLSLCHVATSLRTARVYDDSIPSSTAQPFARPISRDLPRDEPPSPSFRYIARRRGRTSTQGRGGGEEIRYTIRRNRDRAMQIVAPFLGSEFSFADIRRARVSFGRKLIVNELSVNDDSASFCPSLDKLVAPATSGVCTRALAFSTWRPRYALCV